MWWCRGEAPYIAGLVLLGPGKFGQSEHSSAFTIHRPIYLVHLQSINNNYSINCKLTLSLPDHVGERKECGLARAMSPHTAAATSTQTT